METDVVAEPRRWSFRVYYGKAPAKQARDLSVNCRNLALTSQRENFLLAVVIRSKEKLNVWQP